MNILRRRHYCVQAAIEELIKLKPNYGLSVKHRVFSLHDDYFKVLPVLSSYEWSSNPNNAKCSPKISVKLFGSNHPTKCSYPELDTIIAKRKLRTDYVAESTQDFCYTTAALVCQEINGRAFIHLPMLNGEVIWFIITEGITRGAKDWLELIDDAVANFVHTGLTECK